MTFAKYLAFVSVLGACARQPFIANTGPSRTVTVEIESNEPRSVFARIAGSSVATATGAGGTVTAGATEYENICTGSCTAEIDPQQSYVFLGVSGWQHRSSSFVIHTNSDRYKLRLDSGSQSGWMWGFAGVVFGAAMTVGGVTLAASATDQYDTGTGGKVMLGIGLPMLIVGAVVMLSNGTTITNAAGKPLAREQPRHGRSKTQVAGLGWTF